jgi:hypothetical protein
MSSGQQELPQIVAGVPPPPPITSPITSTLRRETVNIDNSPLTSMYNLTSPKISSPNPIPLQKSDSLAGPLPPSLDRIEILTQDFLKKCSSQPLDLHHISEDFDGMKMLAKSGCWKEAVKLSGRLLSAPESKTNVSAANKSLLSPLHQLRFEGLFKLKLYDDLAQEVSSILSFHNCEQAINVTVSDPVYDVVLSMKMLLIEIKMMTGHSQDALEQLYDMQRMLGGRYASQSTSSHTDARGELTPSLVEQDSFEYWSFQIKLHVINAFLRLRQWKSAYYALRKVTKEVLTLLSTEGLGLADKEYLTKAMILLLTRVSRTALHMGAVSTSRAYFDRATLLMRSLSEIDNTTTDYAGLEQHLLLNEALLCFGCNEFETASELFLAVSRSSSYDGDVDSDGVSASTFQSRFTRLCSIGDQINAAQGTEPPIISAFNVGLSTGKRFPYIESSINSILGAEEDSFTVTAVNNYSICAMYLKRINEAISRLEALILLNPVRNMVDPVVFNVCTLYDLSYAPEISSTKKKVLQKVAVLFHVVDPVLHWRSFRLN